jgi:hypothetical protein
VVYRRSASSGAVATPKTAAVGGFAARLCRSGRGTKWSGPACSGGGAVKRGGRNARLVERMSNLHRVGALRGRCRAAATWLAFVALLGNVLLPPGRVIPGLGICGHWPGDAPDKTKPGLLVQHCPLCAVPAAPLPRPPRFAVPGEFADQSQLQLRATPSVAPIQRGRMQARAPPSVV